MDPQGLSHLILAYFEPDLAYFELDLAYFEPELAYFQPYLTCFESVRSRRSCFVPTSIFLAEIVISEVTV